MPKFSYVVKDRQGKTYKNVVDALHKTTLVEKLQQQGYFVVSVQELSSSTPRKKAPSKKLKRFKYKNVKLHDLLTFGRQLATMLEAGVPLIRSMDVILSQIQSENFHKVIFKVKTDVEHGSSLSGALGKHPKVFNQFWVSLIEVGEASGTIPMVLAKLSFYLEQQAAFRSTIISGIIYPAILFCVAMGAVVFFALFVGPRFESIFNSMGVDLPMITIILLATFKFIKNYFFLLVGATFVAVWILKNYFKTYQGRLIWEKIMFSLPTIGDIYKLIVVERFTAQMSILIDVGVPILFALDITERLVNNNTCALIVNSIKESVKEGELLVGPMERSGFFPPMAIQMIMVGEETGELSKMLGHVSRFYQDSVETFMKRFATIIEPFMLVFMGGVIGTIVLAMFLPMFNIAQLGGG